MEKEVCTNEGCYSKYAPAPGLEPGLCVECSKIVSKTRIALLNELRVALWSEVYWQKMKLEIERLNTLESY